MVDRRGFMQWASAGGMALAAAALPDTSASAAPLPTGMPVDRLVALTGDNVPMRLADYPAQLLAALADLPGSGDFYLAEGAVSALEAAFSKILGKQDAVFMPTGTLANQIAIRLLCGDRRRLLLQQHSHVYQDEGDAASILGGINPVPLQAGPGQELCTEIEAAFSQQSEAPYPVDIGAISLESPIRRLDGATLTPDLVQRIAALARQHGAGLHLDGARLLLMCGTPGFEVRGYCAPFDTVYVSLYKYLGAPFGAVLAGSKALMDRARAYSAAPFSTAGHRPCRPCSGWPGSSRGSRRHARRGNGCWQRSTRSTASRCSVCPTAATSRSW
ncbi:MAG: beta-eliminating lyase-related protein [Pseudoxanthomonas sp.]